MLTIGIIVAIKVDIRDKKIYFLSTLNINFSVNFKFFIISSPHLSLNLLAKK